MRGKEEIVRCENCGRMVSRNKAVVFYKNITFSTDLHDNNDVKFFEKRKVYYCISCAKHLGIFEKKKSDFKKKKDNKFR